MKYLILAAVLTVQPLPSVKISTAAYSSRDLDAINKALDDFDSQCQGINMDDYVIELRLLKK